MGINTTGLDFTPGLTAHCFIEVAVIPDTFSVPIDCIFERDSAQVVFVRHGDAFQPQRINVGQKNTDFGLVLSGLRGGEKLALREPLVSLIQENSHHE